MNQWQLLWQSAFLGMIAAGTSPYQAMSLADEAVKRAQAI